MADATQNTFRDPRTYGLNEVRHQRKTWHVEGGVVAGSDTLEITHPDYNTVQVSAGEGPFPHVAHKVFSHDGGLTYDFTAVATDDAGDTVVLEFINPHDQLLLEQKDMQPGPPNYVEVVHVLGDHGAVTDNAITAIQFAASLNADPAVSRWAYAAVSGTDVFVIPRGPQGHVRKGTGSTADAIQGKNTVPAVLNEERTFTELTPVSWLSTYSQGKVTITNSGASLARIFAVVTFF